MSCSAAECPPDNAPVSGLHPARCFCCWYIRSRLESYTQLHTVHTFYPLRFDLLLAPCLPPIPSPLTLSCATPSCVPIRRRTSRCGPKGGKAMWGAAGPVFSSHVSRCGAAGRRRTCQDALLCWWLFGEPATYRVVCKARPGTAAVRAWARACFSAPAELCPLRLRTHAADRLGTALRGAEGADAEDGGEGWEGDRKEDAASE